MIRDKKQYRILVIEDNPGDYVIVEDLLREQILMPAITHAVNYNQAVDILAAGNLFDIILLDLSLPDKSGQQLVTEIVEVTSLCCPVIILTGYTDIAFSIRSVVLGISDYLLKDDLDATILYKSIIYAIERKKNVSELERSQKQYSDLFYLSPQPMWVFDAVTFAFLRVNKAATELYGYSREEFMNMTLMDIKLEEDIPRTKEDIIKGTDEDGIFTGQFIHRKRSGDLIEVDIYSTPLILDNKNCRSVIAIDVTEKNQYENKITKAIIKTQEDERYEIGGELHDNVCQLLAVSQLSLGMLKDSISPERIHWYDQGKNNIGAALDEIRKLSHRLAPAFFNDSTLEEAFRRLFGDFNINKSTEIILHFDRSISRYAISRDIQLNLYRIMQEQLRNILKYAGASVIEVDVLVYNNKLKMKVADNGVGFNTKVVSLGIGLANMKRRAGLFSGTFNIESSPGKGCTIIIDIPLKSKIEMIPIKKMGLRSLGSAS